MPMWYKVHIKIGQDNINNSNGDINSIIFLGISSVTEAWTWVKHFVPEFNFYFILDSVLYFC